MYFVECKKGVFLQSEKVDPTYLFKCSHMFAKLQGNDSECWKISFVNTKMNILHTC